MAATIESRRLAQVVATSAGSVFLVCLVTGIAWLIVRDDSFVSTAIVVNAAVGLMALATWSGAVFPGKEPKYFRPEHWKDWIAMFWFSIPISALFLFIDCGWHLSQMLGGTACDRNPGITVVFTAGSLAMTAIALPSALRAWLLAFLTSPTDSVHG
jgi:hypothetical protein